MKEYLDSVVGGQLKSVAKHMSAFALMSLTLTWFYPLAARASSGSDIQWPVSMVLSPIAEVPPTAPAALKPEIHWPRTVGCSPNRPFLFRVPATGRAPLTFSATGLPAGIEINRQSGILNGADNQTGKCVVSVEVSNSLGRTSVSFTIVCGKAMLAQTPPMGWVSSDVYGNAVTDADIRKAADGLISSGLAAHGYQYVLLGDSWEGKRDDDEVLLANDRFPDMKGLIEYIHSKGLKFGIYSAATSKTDSGYEGSLGREEQDAKEFAAWGVDYLTYDWCPNANEATSLNPQTEYAAMGQAINDCGRDIVYDIKMIRRNHEPSAVGNEVYEPDTGVYDDSRVILSAAINCSGFEDDISAGHWVGLGPLQIGRFGYPDMRLTRLMPSEQMMQMSLWSLFSAPLFVSCDLDHLNPNLLNHYTSDILTNDELLRIDQDPSSQPAQLVSNEPQQSIWMKPLSDGRTAIVFLNVQNQTLRQHVDWSDLNIAAKERVRDVWKHTELGTFDVGYDAVVPAHGVVMIVAAPTTQGAA
jgi:alpha-galactosidase